MLGKLPSQFWYWQTLTFANKQSSVSTYGFRNWSMRPMNDLAPPKKLCILRVEGTAAISSSTHSCCRGDTEVWRSSTEGSMTWSQLYWLWDNTRSHLMSSLSASLLIRVLSSCGSLMVLNGKYVSGQWTFLCQYKYCLSVSPLWNKLRTLQHKY